MKVKLNQLKPNPFKKFIENGKLNEDRISILEESIEHGTLPESFFARKKEGTLELTSGHHRIEALKRKKGQHYEVEVTLLNYTDEQMLVDMVRENITQRNTEFHDTKDSIVLARAWLQSGVLNVKQFNNEIGGAKHLKGLHGTAPLEDSYRSIAKFLSKNGKAVSYVTIKNYLDINDKLNPKLLARVGKVKAGVNGNLGKEIPMKDALNLVRIENQEEQEEVAEALFKAEKNGIDRGKLLTAYKEAPDDLKAKVRKGIINITDIPFQIEQNKIEEIYERGQKTNDEKAQVITSRNLLQAFRIELDDYSRATTLTKQKILTWNLNEYEWFDYQSKKELNKMLETTKQEMHKIITAIEDFQTKLGGITK